MPNEVPNSGTILPVHNGLQPLSTGSGHTGYGFYSNSLTAYTGLATSASGSSHSTFKVSGYAYIDTAISTIVKQFDDPINCTDSLINIPVSIEDYITNTDNLFVIVNFIKSFEDTFDSTDTLSTFSLLGDTVPQNDSLLTHYVKIFTETTQPLDTIEAIVPFYYISSCVVQSSPSFGLLGTTTVSVDGFENRYVGTSIVNVSTSIASVTNASSLDNSFLPTIIVGGVTYVTNACTAPPPGYVVTGDTYYVQYSNTGIGGISFCQMTNSNLNLDYSGGSFSITSTEPLGISQFYQGNLGRTVDAYGLTGTITDFGESVNTSENFFITNGIFGNPNLNKPFNLITFGSSQYFSFINGQNSIQYAPQINSYTTIKGMAESIASLCGIRLSWLIPDAPYRDIFNQSGITGWEALSTLASQMGGQLRWNGYDKYIVCYPDYLFGSFDIPNSKLLTSSGMKYQWHQDMSYGVSGAGVLGVPTNVYFDPSTKTLPTNANVTPAEDIEIVGTITKPFTSDDPTITFDLPNDIVSVKIQILVKTGTVTAGARYVTDNPTIWFDLGTPSISNPYVTITKVGNSFVNQIKANYTLFPNLTAINNGNFVMSFGIIRRSLQTQFESAQQDTDLLRRELQAKITGNIKYLKTYSGSVSFYFFGAVPLPGMFVSVNYCGKLVSGVIEQVSITGTGIVTIEVAQYLRINLLDRKLQMDLTSSTLGET